LLVDKTCNLCKIGKVINMLDDENYDYEPEYDQEIYLDDIGDCYCLGCKNFIENGYSLNGEQKPICKLGNDVELIHNSIGNCKDYKQENRFYNE